MSAISSFKEMRVYKEAYELALDVFITTRKFPREEKFLLVNQILRSSRSVCANIAEAYRKRQYPKHFISKLSDSDNETSETMIWLDFSKDPGYITETQYLNLSNRYRIIGKMLGGMMKDPEKLLPRSI